MMWDRVARTWAIDPGDYEDFYEMMSTLKALPNTPAIANAGRERQQGSACFVLPIDDSLNVGDASIMKTLDAATRVHATGGGTGFSFGRLRGRGEMISSTGRPSPGSVEILKMYSDAIGRISQGGVRWGANMGVLPINHPDIEEFISCKQNEFVRGDAEIHLETMLQTTLDYPAEVRATQKLLEEYYVSKNHQGTIHNFNISVAIDDDFMLRRRFDGHDRDLWERIVYGAWSNGEPGILWMERINERALHPEKIEATNPCGEVPLLPNEACVLGSIDISKHTLGRRGIDWGALADTTRVLTRLLDNVVELQDYPLPIIKKTHKYYRKIGVGIMGLADAFIQMELIYGEQESIRTAAEIMKFVQNISWNESEAIGRRRGFYPGYVEGMPKRRNLMVQVVAPTGTISRIARCSFGIEPNYAKVQESYILGATEPYIDRHKYANSEWFITTTEVTLDQHIDMLCAIQAFTDQAVSKTCNAPMDATPEDIEAAFVRAYEGGAKGLTVLRTGSRVKVTIKDHSGKHDEDDPLEDVAIAVDCVSGVCAL